MSKTINQYINQLHLDPRREAAVRKLLSQVGSTEESTPEETPEVIETVTGDELITVDSDGTKKAITVTNLFQSSSGDEDSSDVFMLDAARVMEDTTFGEIKDIHEAILSHKIINVYNSSIEDKISMPVTATSYVENVYGGTSFEYTLYIIFIFVIYDTYSKSSYVQKIILSSAAYTTETIPDDCTMYMTSDTKIIGHDAIPEITYRISGDSAYLTQQDSNIFTTLESYNNTDKLVHIADVESTILPNGITNIDGYYKVRDYSRAGTSAITITEVIFYNENYEIYINEDLGDSDKLWLATIDDVYNFQVSPTVKGNRKSINYVTTVASVPVIYDVVVANITASESFSLASTPSVMNDREIHIIINNTSEADVVVTLPTASPYVCITEDAITIAAGGYAEVNAISDGNNVYLRGV